jgi:hypothetical protein
MATKRKGKTGRKRAGAKRSRTTKKPRPKRAAKAKARKTKTRKAKVRAKPRKPARKAPARVKARRPPARIAAKAVRPLAVETAAAPAPAAPPPDQLRMQVERAFERLGYQPPDATAVDVVTAVARGYRAGPATAPPSLRFEADTAVAEGWAERYETGDRSPGHDRMMHRAQVKWTVVFNLEQLGIAATTGEPERDVLASLCLGCWDPATMTNAERDAAASFVVRWYRDGS